MSDTTQISEIEAIRQVIEDGSAMDFVDVVSEVQKRFRLEVTSAQVEEVVHDLVTKKKPKVRPGSRVSVNMTSNLPADDAAPTCVEQAKSTNSETPSAQLPMDELSHALHFVKSVHGLANAKRALAELESILSK